MSQEIMILINIGHLSNFYVGILKLTNKMFYNANYIHSVIINTT